MSTAELVVLVPSRGRPASAERLQQAFARTTMADTALVFVVGEDDPTVHDYLDVEQSSGGQATVMVTFAEHQGSGFVAPLNWGAEVVAANWRPFALGFMGDDHCPRTAGWDKAYLDALHEMGTGYVYGNDLIQGENIPTQIAMTTNIFEAFGYMANPIVKHLFADNMWRDLGKAAGCIRYLPDVTVEHLHYTAGRSAEDETYRIGNSSERWNTDPARYQQWLNGPEFLADLQTLKGILP